MQEIESVMELLRQGIESVAESEVIVGEPIELGTVTVVPLSRLSLGMSAGEGSGEGEGRRDEKSAKGRGSGQGAGSGGGARVRPVAVVAFNDQGVKVLPVPEKRGSLDRLIDKIPGWVERFGEIERPGKKP